MWRPEERIKYQPLPGGWPSRREANDSKLFSQIKIGNTELHQRTWVPAMVPWRATEDGFVTPELLAWYERFARGKPGVIVVEATGIRDIPSGPLLRIGHARYLPGLKQLVETVHKASEGKTRLFIQLIDFLRINRRPTVEKYFQKHLELSDRHREWCKDTSLSDEQVREKLAAASDDDLKQALTPREYDTLTRGYRERVDDLHLAHIRTLPQALPRLFSEAAARAKECGFDGVELHYAHAYTMASFLSARNQRTDGYGGSRKNRIRLPLEVYAKVRQTVGPDYVIGCRYLSEDCIKDGLTVDDAAYFGTEFSRVGMDFISLSRGGKFEDAKQPKIGAAAYPYTGRSGYECMPQYISDASGPFGRNIPATIQIRKAIRDAGFAVPVVAVGGIHSFAQAEKILHDGEGDIIGSARQTLADPDWFLKMKLGVGEQVRVCLFTNYCEALDTKHKQVTCELWDREAREEAGVMLSNDGRRRLNAPQWKDPSTINKEGPVK